MIPEERIDPALKKIEKLLAEQCIHGAQTRDMGPNMAACGQFIGPAAKNLTQHGLYGTAAALRVLAQGTSADATKVVPRLVSHLQELEERNLPIKKRSKAPTTSVDVLNVIKLSEVLYALSFVQASQCHTDTLVSAIAGKLLKARREEKGWTHFLDTASPVDVLPTAFAVLALSRHGQAYEQQIQKQIDYLESNVVAVDGSRSLSINDNSVKIFCLFALVFRKDEIPQEEVKRLKPVFVGLWKAHQGLFDQNVEQNIQYSRGPENYYIRIPWQLYLLALAARLDPHRISSFAARRRLNQILDAVMGDGFLYPYSGSSLSSRTNAIVFDVLHKVKRFNKRNLVHSIYYGYDVVQTFFSRPIFSCISLTLFLGFAAYCVCAWMAKEGKPEDVGPDLTGAMIGIGVAFFLERLRKSR